MRPCPLPHHFGLVTVGFAAALTLGMRAAHAEEPAPSAASAPPIATSQCSEGPGAPPADPTKVTRFVPGSPGAAKVAAAPPEEPPIDEPPTPNAPAPVLLELGLNAGVSVRLDDAPVGVTTRRAGLALGGSVFVWPSRILSFGASYQHTDLSRSENEPDAIESILIAYETHTLLAEARVVPLRFAAASLFLSLGGGFAWQTIGLRATIPPVTGDPGGSVSCNVGSGAEFAFRGALGVKARLGRAGALLADASFVGYRLGSEVIGDCAYGAGTAQTLLFRAAFTYDIDISRLVR